MSSSASFGAALGARFEVRAVHLGERIDTRGLDSLSPQPPLMLEVGAGYAALLRSGAVVTFGASPADEERLIESIAARVYERHERHERLERERAVVRIGDPEVVEPDALVLKEATLERLQLVAEVLGKSVILARYEQAIADAFTSIEPLAIQLTRAPDRRPWKQRDLVRHIGAAMLAQHRLVGRAEVLEKPDLLWDNPALDRLYARLADEYELRDRQLTLEHKLAVVTRAAETMLNLHQARRSYKVEWYIVGLILFELAFNVFQLVR